MNNIVAVGFEGKVFPVKPKYKEVDGRRCFPRVADIPGVPNLAVPEIPKDALEVSADSKNRCYGLCRGRMAVLDEGGVRDTGCCPLQHCRAFHQVTRSGTDWPSSQARRRNGRRVEEVIATLPTCGYRRAHAVLRRKAQHVGIAFEPRKGGRVPGNTLPWIAAVGRNGCRHPRLSMEWVRLSPNSRTWCCGTAKVPAGPAGIATEGSTRGT
ncbi:hypothetical protein [Mesorhizobium sp. A623]